MVALSLIGALLYWMAFKLLGSDFSYKSSLAVTLHAAMPAVVSLLLSLPVILSKSSHQLRGHEAGRRQLPALEPRLPGSGRRSELADRPVRQRRLLLALGPGASIIGFRAVSRKPTQPVAITVIVIWLIFVAIRVGWVALFG